MLVSGYFRVRLSADKFLRFYMFCALAGLACYLFHLIVDKQSIGISILKNTFLCISNTWCWYVPVYAMFMILSPIFNFALDAADKRQKLYMVLATLVVSVYFGWLWDSEVNKAGYGLMQFITMYFIGDYIRNYYRSKKWHFVYGMVIWILFAMGAALYDFHFVGGKLWCYNNPLTIMSSIGFFIMFLNLSFSSKIINCVASGAFAVYLIHSNVYVQKPFYEWGRTLYSSGVWGFMAYVAIVFVLCCALGVLFHVIIKWLSPMIINKLSFLKITRQ